MFAKGNRFPPSKPSEVPGPNAYNVEDPEFDAYKKGAILEKQERFGKEKESDVPGPGAYTTDTKPKVSKIAGGAKATSGDRYAALQRKLEDLERVHAESKKAHQADLERVKFDLSRAQKANSEHVERIDKLKKQNDLLEVKTQELRKANLSDQSEIRDLRVKLRAAEHERAQLAGKQGEAGEAKKALQALDARRREELKEKDRKITDLEKMLAAEKKQKEILESRLAETKGKLDEEARVQRGALEADLCQAQVEKERALEELEVLREHAQEMEEDLLEQLEQHKLLLCRVAAEYGRLAASAVSKTAHERVQREVRSLKCRVYRLERKYANAEGQIVELAQLIRQTSDQNSILQDRLHEAEEDLIAYSTTSSHTYKEALFGEQADDNLYTRMRDVFADIIRSDEETREFLRADWAIWSELDSLRSEQLLFHSTNLVKHALDARRQVEAQADQLLAAEGCQSELSLKLSVAAAERDATRAQLVEASTSLSIAQTRVKELEKELETEKKRTKSEVVRLEQAVRREKEAYEKTSGMLQQSRAAERALTAEIDQLTADLADAERYQDAYASLVDQVDALVRKNALAEDEAQRISKFNAEILGHHNPAQRIMYVDRIRKELHETKHNFVMLAKERDARADENDAMQRELQMYKSVAVPADYKPRTTVTRVSRTPLANQSLNARSTAASKVSSTLSAKRLESTPEDEYKEGDMTIDELL